MYTALPKTKEVLFDQAIQLFAQYGYENVSVRTIAQRTGIQPSSIYNHYDSKEAFLTEIYTYYVRHCSDSRVPLGRAKKIMEKGTRKEIISCLFVMFHSPDEVKTARLVLTTKIIWMRMFQDETAKKLCLDLLKSTIEYTTEILNHGIAIGRIPPFDVDNYAMFLFRERSMMGMIAFLDEHYSVRKLPEEEEILKMADELLPPLREI